MFPVHNAIDELESDVVWHSEREFLRHTRGIGEGATWAEILAAGFRNLSDEDDDAVDRLVDAASNASYEDSRYLHVASSIRDESSSDDDSSDDEGSGAVLSSQNSAFTTADDDAQPRRRRNLLRRFLFGER